VKLLIDSQPSKGKLNTMMPTINLGDPPVAFSLIFAASCPKKIYVPRTVPGGWLIARPSWPA